MIETHLRFDMADSISKSRQNSEDRGKKHKHREDGSSSSRRRHQHRSPSSKRRRQSVSDDEGINEYDFEKSADLVLMTGGESTSEKNNTAAAATAALAKDEFDEKYESDGEDAEESEKLKKLRTMMEGTENIPLELCSQHNIHKLFSITPDTLKILKSNLSSISLAKFETSWAYVADLLVNQQSDYVLTKEDEFEVIYFFDVLHEYFMRNNLPARQNSLCKKRPMICTGMVRDDEILEYYATTLMNITGTNPFQITANLLISVNETETKNKDPLLVITPESALMVRAVLSKRKRLRKIVDGMRIRVVHCKSAKKIGVKSEFAFVQSSRLEVDKYDPSNDENYLDNALNGSNSKKKKTIRVYWQLTLYVTGIYGSNDPLAAK